ncbi:hypothetical protein P3X46_027988 [Hevea brasiliensis]|uniref:RRM domain-containing protein n=1 Tax=Hevea brasiliensis TaxID=3981 RepID=A0ABQ9KN66_HEVBR|nr:protein REPRESSOR OF SILENCING 3 isoform X2 [Hevea brasiliensis]KAJ9145625.1 hypothetical protein P3X46_027988 [Hevea brasiliensis]
MQEIAAGRKKKDMGGDDNFTRTRVRIYVGGLGESVTTDDLQKIFSKMDGEIESVDIIRTKGRGFAYLDFLPSSHNSLSKLFSTYNGCVWKGGRLRLEKAKENFLDRLKREWAEDAQLASGKYTTHVNDDVGKELESLERPREVHSSRKKQLNIFFPRLQKVKSLPFSGTGKHKYSFRRVEVPSLPTHFCDCEEHSGPLHHAEEKQIPVQEEEGGGMTKEELDVMNSVMNKLFEMENISTTAHSDIELTKEEDYSMQLTNDPLLDESDGYSTADEDNLIINVVSRGQESKLNKRKAPKDGPTEDMLEKQTRNHEENNENEYESAIARGKGNLQAHLNGSAILPGAQLIEPQSGDKQSAPKLSWSQKSSWKELIGDRSNSAINISGILPGISSDKKEQSKSDGVPNSINSKNKKLLRHENQRVQSDKTEVEELVEAQPAKMDSSSNKTGRGSAWLHKTSWTQLVNSNNGSSFSITQILPGVTFEKQELAKPHGVITTDARDHKNNNTIEKGKSESFVDGTMDLQIIRDCDVQKTVEPRQLHVLGSDNASASTENKQNSATKRPRKGDIVIGETCSFMRTDASLKEWANAKAALSGSRNRTSKGKKMLTSH